MPSNLLKRMRVLKALVAGLVQVAVAISVCAEANATENRSVAELLAAPNTFTGKQTKVAGYFLQPSSASKNHAVLCERKPAEFAPE